LPAKYLGFTCFLPIFLPNLAQPVLNIHFLEVGQGTAVVVETKNHQLVYDTGKKFSQRFDSGKHIVAPYLLQAGHSHIDTLIISHGDSDHAGGVKGLSSLIEVGNVYSGQPTKTDGEQCVAGQSWQWDGLHFSVLWPSLDYLSKLYGEVKSNNLSCVLLIEYGEYRFLLTGDIEKSVEKRLLALYPERLQNMTIVLAPHHGSGSSSHNNWVNHLQAKYAIVSAGYTNAYGHPHPRVVERYQRVNSEVEHTGNRGAIGFTVNADGLLSLRRWREVEKRYWYD
jgi:competence protein ComEC